MLGADLDTVQTVIKDHFSTLKPELVEKNLEAAQKGFEKVADVTFEKTAPGRPVCSQGHAYFLCQGHLHWVRRAADCRVGAFYPMSPATGIMQHLTELSEHLDLVVEQAEDEIAAANIVIGGLFCRGPGHDGNFRGRVLPDD